MSEPPPQEFSPVHGAEKLAALRRRLLARAGAGAEDDFFALGGDSLLAARLISHVREELGVELTLRDVLCHPRLVDLVERAGAAPNAEARRLPRVSRDRRRFPLSPAQHHRWSHTTSAHLSWTLRFSGPLHVEALGRGLEEVVRRHESLRTRFEVMDAAPCQVIDAARPPELLVVDLEGLDARRQAEVLHRGAVVEAAFDLGRGPLLRSVLLRLGVREHVLALTLHPIVADSWSTRILSFELVTSYRAATARRPCPLPELEVQYVDFAHWLSSWLRGRRLESQLGYWRSRWSREPAALYLATDRGRPPRATHSSALQLARLCVTESETVRRHAVRHRTTLNMFLLSAFKALLHRYTVQPSVRVGTLAANRRWHRTESVVGPFANTLVIEAPLSSETSFRELLARVRETTLEACQHQDVPFETLLEQLRPDGDASAPALFQVMFLLQDLPMPDLPELPGLRIESTPALGVARHRLDLTLSASTSAGGELAFEWHFNADLFLPTTIDRMTRHFRSLLAGAVERPERALCELPMLSAAERHQLVPEWNQVDRDPLGNEPCVHERIAAWALATPEALAVVDGKRHLSYGAFQGRIERTAESLRARGVGVETLVAVCLERSLEMIAGMLAALGAGAAYLPLEPATPVQRLAGILEDSGTPVLLTRPEQPLPELNLEVVYPETRSSHSGPVRRSAPGRSMPGNTAYVIYTSGSTGQPKGVVITHRSLANLVTTAARLYSVRPGERVLQFTSCMFDPSTEEIFTSLTQGATLVLRDDAMTSSPARFLERVARWKISVLGLPTAFWHEIAAHLVTAGPKLGGALRLITIGGEKALVERVRQWHEAVAGRVRLFNCYGPTEGTVFATAWQLPDGFSGHQVPIGFPIPNVGTYLLGPDLASVPIAVPGQLCIGGIGLARAYLRRPALSAASFIPSPFSRRPGRRLYQTGDMARYLPSGAIEFLARIDHQVKVRGFRVEIGEVESVLSRLPGVRKAVVLATRPPGGSLRLTGYVRLERPGQHAKEVARLREGMRQFLPEYMVPSAFVVVEQFPMTPSGKVDGRALQEQAPVAPAADFVAPRGEVEKRLAGIWSELLDVDRVGALDDFFELGGHSLLVPRLLVRLREVFDLDLAPHKAFAAPTLARMAAEIETASHEPAPQDAAPTLDLAREAALEDALKPTRKRRPGPPRVIFLTGATGFVGTFLLHELLRRTAAEVHCLVRAATPVAGRGRLRERPEAFQLWDDAFETRIVPVLGDLSRPRLGLERRELERLAEHVDVVYHCGAKVSELQPYSTLKDTNVSGTREVVRLACRAGAVLHHVSTLDVFPPPSSGTAVAREGAPPEPWQGLAGGYARSKWVAEKLVTHARERGLRAFVYRLGAISGHSLTGAGNPDDFMSSYLRGCIELGMVPEEAAPADLTPVDYLVRAMVHLSLNGKGAGEVFHLANPHPLPMREVAEHVRAAGYPLEQVPYRRWRAALVEHVARDPDSPLAAFMPLFGPEPGQAALTVATEVAVDQSHTRAALANSGIECPAVDSTLLDTYFRHFRRRGFLREPP